MNNKLKNILLYTGTIGAIIAAIAYIVITVVLVLGFNTEMDLTKQLLFSIIGAVDGVLITFMLREQGIMLAKSEPEAIQVMKEYNTALNKTKPIKKLRTIGFFRKVNLVKDVITKMSTLAISTWGILYIFMEGNGDYGLIWLAIANILMFVCFGVMALSKAYDFYSEEHLSAIREITIKLQTEKTQKQVPILLIQENTDQAGSILLEREING